MDRRDFLKSALAGSVAAGAAFSAGEKVPKRRYKNNDELSIVALGGVVVMGMTQKDADAIVAQSFERGVNYYDVAPSYGDGEAETKLGPALRPFRDKVFLACKTTERDAAGSAREFERSLKRLYTDHFDLYQFHAVTTMEDVEKILGPGGAAETFLKARQQGKVRYLGCSAHSEEAAIAMLDRFPLDSILFPVNYVCISQADFGPRVISHAKEKGVARLALKALAQTPWADKHDPARAKHPKTWYKPIDDRELAEKALRFTLSEDITAAVPPGDENIYRMAVDIASHFTPLTAEERQSLLASAKAIKPIFPQA